MAISGRAFRCDGPCAPGWVALAALLVAGSASADPRVTRPDVPLPLPLGRVYLDDSCLPVASNESMLRVHDCSTPAARVVVRQTEHRTEDWVMIRQRPARQRLRYVLELKDGLGLRLVPGTRVLEIIDEKGIPRLRMLPPYWWPGESLHPVGQTRHPIDLELIDCEYDRSPLPPWGRPRTSPGKSSCTVELGWDAAQYPIVVDPVWTTTESMAFSRTGHIAERIAKGRVLVAGGSTTESATTVEVWDGASGTWAMTAPLPTPHHEARSVALAGSRVLVVGGSGESGCSFSAEVYDPGTGQWKQTSSMHDPRCAHAASKLPDGRVLVTGGRTGKDQTVLASTEVLDPDKGSWMTAQPMSGPRMEHAAAPLPDGRIMVAGGEDEDASTKFTPVLSSTELFDSGTGAWKTGPPLPGPRKRFSALSLHDGRLLLLGGRQGDASIETRTDLLDPITETWIQGAPAPAGSDEHAAKVLNDGRVLVTGGSSFVALTSAALMFSPTSQGGSWSTAGELAQPRFRHTMTVLEDGSVLVAGGSDGTNELSSAEAFRLAGTGSACKSAGECASAWCVDGVCCENACTSVCRACSRAVRGGEVEDGLCAAVWAGTDPKQSCAAQERCGTTGLCDGEGSCALAPAAQSCGAPSCSEGLYRTPVCDGAGSCVEHATRCPQALRCPDGRSACPSSCEDDLGCLDDRVCLAGQCVERVAQGGTCGPGRAFCDSSLRCVEGLCCDTAGAMDCGSYRCSESGVCRGECGSSADCIPGARCDGSGHCSREPVAEPAGGACSCSWLPSTGGLSRLAVVGILAAFSAARRSRRRVAAISLIILCCLAPSEARAGSPPPQERAAMEMFRRGNELRRQGDLNGALDWYQRSSKTSASVSNLWNTASCMAQLGRHDEALEVYEQLLVRFGDRLSDDQRRVFEAAIGELRAVLGEAVISTNVAGDLLVDGRLRGQVPRTDPLLLNSGTHTLQLVAPGHEAAGLAVVVKPGERVSVELKATPIVRERTRTVVREVRNRPWGAEAIAGLAFGPSLRGEVAMTCPGSCPNAHGVVGQLVGARLRYQLASPLALEAAAGYLRLTQSVERTFTSGPDIHFSLHDNLVIAGPFAGLGAAVDLPISSRFTAFARGTMLAWVTRASDEATATVMRGETRSRAIVEGSGEASSALDLAVMPEVGLAWTAGSWRIGAGIAAGFFLLRGPALALGETAPVIDGPCPPGTTEARCAAATAASSRATSSYGMFAIAVPTISFGTTGW